MSEKRQGGILNDWMVRDILFTEGMEPKQCIMGTITDDDFWDDGLLIRSSLIVKLDEENGTVETRNTIYQLGAKFNEKIQ